jgi:hypothetical protein
MKLRVDLVEKLTEADLMDEILANNHRYKPEPNFSKTGGGSLSATSTEERAKELEHGTELIRKLEARSLQKVKTAWRRNRLRRVDSISS